MSKRKAAGAGGAATVARRMRIAPSDAPGRAETRDAPDLALPRVPTWLTLAWVVAAALAMRLWALSFQPIVTVDGTDYVRFADALAKGQPFASIFPPGYPVLAMLARAFVHDRVLAAQAVSVACGVLLPVPVWFLARAIVGPKWAVVPALAVALHPELARFSAVTMSESAFLLLLFTGLAFAITRFTFASGLFLGAAFAVRPEALVSVVALGVREAWRAARERTAPRSLLLGLAGFLVLAAPCWIYFHATLGEWTLTPKLGAMHATVTDWRLDERRFRLDAAPDPERGTLATVIHDVPVALRQYPKNALAHGRSLLELWPLPLLLLSIAGLSRRRGAESVALLGLLLLPLLGLTRQPRFVLAAVPALAILATVPIALARGRVLRALMTLLWIAGATWCAFLWAKPFRIPLDGSFESHRQAGLWLAGAAEPSAVVLDRKPYVAFYAGRTYRVMPDEPYESLIRFAVSSGARYLVVDQKVVSIFRKQLEPLLYDSEFRDRERRVELVYVGGTARGYGIGIFKVLRPGEAKSGQPPVVEATYLSGHLSDAFTRGGRR